MKRIVWVAVIAACSSKSTTKTEPATGSGSAAPKVAASDAGTGLGSGVAGAVKKATKEQTAEYRKHMKAGWAQQKKHQWVEATKEFEEATKIIDGDQRALSELGWSAMLAGDFKKARTADELAVRVAIDPKVKAASLYNLGLVQEKTGDKQHAAQSFKDSLALRPNKTVEAELASLGTDVAKSDGRCAAGTPACKCIGDDLGVADDEEDLTCAESKTVKPPVAGWHVYDISFGRGSYTYLSDEHDQVVTQIGGGEDLMRHTSNVTLDKTETKTIGGHQVLRLEYTDTESSDYMDETNFDQGEIVAKGITICDVGDATRPTSCVRDLPLAWSSESSHEPIDEEGKSTGAGTSTKKSFETTVTVGEDGIVTVKLVKGQADEWVTSQLGPHTLWTAGSAAASAIGSAK